ncbi:MAG: S8 family serine peptidase [Anaeromyxobacteraceae bacterium]
MVFAQILVVALLAGPSNAADPAAAARALPAGSAFTAGGERYRFVGGARAVARGDGEDDDRALARAGAAGAEILERKGGFLVFRDARATAAAARSRKEGVHAVAVNARTGRVAVVTGILNVRLKKGADAARLARAHGLELVSVAPRLGAAFLRVPAGQDVQAAAAAVAKDPGVASAEIDVIEHLAVPH